MDNYNNNKATPTKRTGENNNPLDRGNDNDATQKITPEITQPNPSTATPSFPTEMPARDTK